MEEASVSTAASAGGSELRRLWALAGVLLVVLLAVAYVLELGEDTHVVIDGALTMPELPASRAALEDELVADAVQLTPTFTIDAPTTLELTLSRSRDAGWVGVEVALVEEESGEIRQLGLATDVRGAVGADPEAERTSTVLIDRVQPGRYVLRLAPSWEPLEEPAAGRAETARHTPPNAHLRVVEGRRSHWGLGLAVALILLPPLLMSGRRLVSGRGRG